MTKQFKKHKTLYCTILKKLNMPVTTQLARVRRPSVINIFLSSTWVQIPHCFLCEAQREMCLRQGTLAPS